MHKVDVIAFYLPQYYPTPENNEWWGKGFTEWTNVGKAKPLFKGHLQPKVPSDLGYYDLRVKSVRDEQVELAKEAGVTAFCYWHYWFGNGKRLLSEVFQEVLETGRPDFPFCLGWANHSWYAKTWDKNSKNKDKLLIEQTYPGEEDARKHFSFLLQAFKDKRYVKVDNCPFFYIFDPKALPLQYISWFRSWAKEAGFSDLYIVANISINDKAEDFVGKGYDAVVFNRVLYYDQLLGTTGWNIVNRGISSAIRTIKSYFQRRPSNIVDFGKYYKNLVTDEELKDYVLPEIVAGWDHSPRSGSKGLIYINTTPNNFYKHCLSVMESIKNKPDGRKIVMLKSWNEWGEGNYMEPDLLYGHSYIKSLRNAIIESL